MIAAHFSYLFKTNYRLHYEIKVWNNSIRIKHNPISDCRPLGIMDLVWKLLHWNTILYALHDVLPWYMLSRIYALHDISPWYMLSMIYHYDIWSLWHITMMYALKIYYHNIWSPWYMLSKIYPHDICSPWYIFIINAFPLFNVLVAQDKCNCSDGYASSCHMIVNFRRVTAKYWRSSNLKEWLCKILNSFVKSHLKISIKFY
jgi:hypothetical protein